MKEGARMHFLRRLLTIPVVAAIVFALAYPGRSSAAQIAPLAEIRGTVHDATGAPLVGALVAAAITSPSAHERIVLTDKRGSFFIPNLLAGQYSLKVTMSRFLPVQKSGIQLNPGATANVTVSLQTAMDVVRRATARERAQSEDIVWTLRSSRSTQPVLRLVESQTEESNPDQLLSPDYTGYFQLYSKSTETAAGPSDSVGSQFSVTMPLQTAAKVTLAGQYNESPDQPRGFGAQYEFTPANRHRAQIGVNVRQGALLGNPLQSDPLREIQLQYGEKFQWSDHVVLDYGAAAGRADAYVDRSYLRPRMAISWVPEPRTTITLGGTSQAPTPTDNSIRGKDYFERSVNVPPALERYLHTELAASRLFSEDNSVSVAVFRDQTDNHAVFVTTPDGRRGLLIFDARRMPSDGVRAHFNHDFRRFSAGVGYTSVTGIGVAGEKSTALEIQKHFERRRFQVVTARFNTDFDPTNTQFTAVYRWVSGFSASALDPYQNLVEFNEPTLSLTVAQALPTWRTFPGKVQAILDARNVFEQPFAVGTAHLASSPRLLKGGINVRF